MRTILGGVLGRIPRPTPAMAVALLALLIAASGAAVAAIPSNGTITACYAKNTGALRVIDSGQSCSPKETQLAWKDGSTLLGKNEKAADSDKLDNKDSSEFLGTDQKASDSDLLDGQDSTAFLGANQKAADSEKLGGIDSSGFAKAYKRTVVVSPVGTDTENGQALLDAISSITDASASKPYLIHIEPATYDLGNRSLGMKQWVDVEGSGELNTVITSGVADSGCENHLGTVNGADNAEMRFLTVRNTGAENPGVGACPIAISNISASPRLAHLTAETGDFFSTAAVFNDDSSPIMTDVTATAGAGRKNESVGVANVDSSPTIRQSKVIGSFRSLELRGTGTAKVALSQLVGLVDASPGTLLCFNNYAANMQAVPESSCPVAPQ